MIYTVTLNPSVDCVMTVGAIAEGATNRASSQELRFGGKGVNVSRALARMGIPSVALGFAAGFTGEALAAGFADEPLITPGFIALRGGFTRVNVKLRGAAETEINAPGPRVAPDEAEAFLRRLDALREGDTAIFSGSLPTGPDAGLYARALKACLPCRPFLVKPNRQEIGELFGDGADPADCAERLCKAGARFALVSLGADGAALADGSGETRFAPALPCEGGCAVGAGDAMLAGFLAEIDRGGPAEALDAAVRSAKEWMESSR